MLSAGRFVKLVKQTSQVRKWLDAINASRFERRVQAGARCSASGDLTE
jgi:hypothetical protein